MVKMKLSSKFQVVIPKNIRREMGLKAGEEMTIVAGEGVINIIPLKPLKKMMGFAKGINAEGLREEKDRI